MSSTNVNLVEGTTFKIDKNSKYLILFDRHMISQYDAREINQDLAKEGFHGITVIIDGDPSKVKILEEKE